MRRIRLTESQLHMVIKESVKRILKEVKNGDLEDGTLFTNEPDFADTYPTGEDGGETLYFYTDAFEAYRLIGRIDYEIEAEIGRCVKIEEIEKNFLYKISGLSEDEYDKVFNLMNDYYSDKFGLLDSDLKQLN